MRKPGKEVFWLMHTTPGNRFYISYCNDDTALAQALLRDLLNLGINVFDLSDIQPGDDLETLIWQSRAIIVILTTSSVHDKFVLENIEETIRRSHTIVPVMMRDCEIPASLTRHQVFDLTSNYSRGIREFAGVIESTFMDRGVKSMAGENTSRPSTLPHPPYAYPPQPSAPPQKKSSNFLKKILQDLNPFKSETKSTDDDVYVYASALKNPPQSRALQQSDKAMVQAPIVPAMPQSMPAPTVPPAPPAPKPAKGKVLYDIPDNMVVRKQHKCIVRIGENEEIVKDNDVFSDAMQIESISISGVMKVDLVDVSEPARFLIKTINSSEQEIESGSYTEWLFWVTPLTDGMYPLILKVSVIRLVDGIERRKELVFEKSITITAEAQVKPVPTMQHFAGTGTTEPV